MSTKYRPPPLAQAAPPSADGSHGDADEAPWADAPEQREAAVDAVLHGARLDKAVVALAPEFSRNHLQGLIAAGHVWIDGQAQRSASRKVSAGQTLRVELVPTQESQAFRPEAMALDVVYEDADLMVLNKRAGHVVHPAAGNWSGTVLNGLLAHHAAAATLPRAGIVHRLDKDTSGLMVVGKTLQAVTSLVRQIAAREVHRQYLAIAHGVLERERQRIDAPLGRDPRSRVRMAVLASGKAAITDVARVAHTELHSALRCTLHTGRTHQIRVHLASLGHPLVADELYGGRQALGLQRQALHATRLALRHPGTQMALHFDAPPPEDFAQAWAQANGPAQGPA